MDEERGEGGVVKGHRARDSGWKEASIRLFSVTFSADTSRSYAGACRG